MVFAINTMRKMRAVELCAGAGGLALGISRAGFKHEALVECDANACETLRDNQRRGIEHAEGWPIFQEDARLFDFGAIAPDIDLLAAGIPCQPFSFAGKGLGQVDPRNMFPMVTRAVRALRPKAILIENVKGLTRPSFGIYLEYLELELGYPEIERRSDESWEDHHGRLRSHRQHGRVHDLEYRVGHCVLNAGDYGVPQWRERIFIVALRADLSTDWSPPPPTHSVDVLLWSQWKSGEYWKRYGLPKPRATRGRISARFAKQFATLRGQKELINPLKPWRTIRDAFAGLPSLKQGQASAAIENHFLNPGARAYRKHTGSPMDEPAKTLKAGSHGVPGGENSLALPRGRIRYFSVRECARLQTFPDEYVFPRVWTRAMRQVGNAVPVLLAEVVAAGVAHQLRQTAMEAHASVSSPALALTPPEMELSASAIGDSSSVYAPTPQATCCSPPGIGLI